MTTEVDRPVALGPGTLLEGPERVEPDPTGRARTPSSGRRPRWVWFSAAPLLLLWLVVLTGWSLPAPLVVVEVVALVAVLGDAALAVLRVPVAGRPVRLVVSVGLGVAVLLLTVAVLALAGPAVGISRPLARVPSALAVSGCWALLWALAPRRARRRRLRQSPPSPRQVLHLLALAGLPAGAAAGAAALSNGHPAVITVGVLVVSLGLLGWCGLTRRDLSPATLAVSVYAVGLALLLMTSLRGAQITGHDVQFEHYVAQVTAQAQRWAPGGQLLADYKACLSITALPAVLSALFAVTTTTCLQLVAPALFAFFPVAVLLAARRQVGRLGAVAAAALVMAFPTYFTDMTMISRQEYAFLLVAVLVLLVATRGDDHGQRAALQRRRVAVLLVGVGIILSHYSTTYLLLVQLALSAGVAAVLRGVALHRRRSAARGGAPRTGRRSSSRASAAPVTRPVVTLGMVLLLGAGAATWAGVVTHSGGSFVGVAGQVVATLTGKATQSDSSNDASVSIFGGGRPLSDQERLDEYVGRALASMPADERAHARELLAAHPVEAVEPSPQAPTAVGRWLSGLGVPLFSTTAVVRTGTAWGLQLLAGLGVAVVLWRSLRRRHDLELALYAAGALVLLAAFVALPLLTTAYGLLRVFQQGLVVLAVPVVMALDVTAVRISSLARRRWRVRPGATPTPTSIPSGGGRRGTAPAPAPERRGPGRAPLLCVLAFALSSTGLSSWVTGGYLAPLHLANEGNNYEDYYLPDADLAAMHWLVDQPGVRSDPIQAAQADLWTSAKVLSQLQLQVYPSFLPFEVRPDSYVLLSTTNVTRDTATTGISNLALDYRVPLDFLEETKDRVYDDGDARVYR